MNVRMCASSFIYRSNAEPTELLDELNDASAVNVLYGVVCGFSEGGKITMLMDMRRFTSTVPARGARAPNRATSNSCL